jgi:hypothetical protein
MKLAGYAEGWSKLDGAIVAANVTSNYRLLDKDGKVVAKKDLGGYISGLRELGDRMELSRIARDGNTVWCKWQVGRIAGAGLITLSDDGVTEEQLFYP